MMKNLLLLTTLLLSFNSYALVIIDSFNYHSSKLALSNIGCLILLPVCILDENANGTALSREYLQENFYTEPEIQLILANQNMMLDIASKENKRVIVGENDTQESLTHDLYTTNPNVDDIYVDFVIANSGL